MNLSSIVVLTGDSEGVAIKVCQKVGIDTKDAISGKDIDNFTDEELLEINNVSKNGDYVRIRGYKYLVDYEENKDSNGLMKKFRIMIQG